MADKKISALPAATTPLAGSEILPIVQGGTTDQVSVANLTSGRTVDMLVANVVLNDAGTNSVSYPVVATHTSSGSTAPGFGVGVNFVQENTTYSSNIQVATIESISTSEADIHNDMVFRTKYNNLLAERARIRNGSDFVLANGNFVPSTAGKGIDFSANTHAAGMTSELLDDYEEGTWVPSVGGDATYTIQEGYYVRVGDLIYVQCQLLLNVLGTGSTTTISGLPFQAFSPVNSSRGTGSVWYCGNLATNVTSIVPGVTPAGQTITFGGFTAAAATMTVPLTVFGNGTRVDFSLVYRAN